MPAVPRSVELVVDSREKYPLLFPETITWHPDRSSDTKLIKLKVVEAKLDYGDYLLAKWPDKAVIERKGSLDELCQNLLTDDYARFTAALDRLIANCTAPYILLDASITDLWTPTAHCTEPAQVWDALCRTVVHRKIPLLWAGSAKLAGPRRILGGQIARLLLAHALTN